MNIEVSFIDPCKTWQLVAQNKRENKIGKFVVFMKFDFYFVF